MSLLQLITFRSLRTRPQRVLLSIMGIVLGVAAFFAIQVTNQTSLEAISKLFESTSGKSDLVITASDVGRRKLTLRELQRLNNSPEISAAVPTVQLRTNLNNDTDAMQIELNLLGIDTGGLLLFGIDPDLDLLVRDYNLVDGEFLSEELDAYEIVLVKNYAEENELEVGDRVQILTPSGSVRMEVVGLISKDGPGQINNGGFGVAPIETLQNLSESSKAYDQIDVIVSADAVDRGSLEIVKENIQDMLGDDYSIVLPAAQGERVNQMLFGYQIGLNFLSGMALFVGMFLIYNAFSMTVVERTREFGFLRTVGMTSGQVTRQVLIEAIVLGIVGAILGVGFGFLLARGLTSLLASLLEEDLAALRITLPILLSSLILGITVTIIAAYIPAWQAGKISPLDALRTRGIRKEGWVLQYGWLIGIFLLAFSTIILVLNPFPNDVRFRFGIVTVSSLFLGATLTIPAAVGIWERVSRPITKLFYGSSGQLGGRNIERAKLRTTLTVAALMIGVAMVLITRGMTDSFRLDLENWIESYVGGDLIVNSSGPIREVVWRHIREIEGVHQATPVRYLPIKWQKPDGGIDEMMYMAVELPSYLEVTSFVFTDSQVDYQDTLEVLSKGEAVFISSVLSERYGLDTGENITLMTRRGLQDFVIAGVVVDFFNQGQVIQGSWMDMQRHFNEEDASMVLVKTDLDSSLSDVQQRIEDRLAKRHNISIASNQDLISRAMRLLRQSYRLFDVLALIALIVAGMGVVNTFTMNVIERTQEIGMLRSIGLAKSQVITMILAEAALIGLIGGFLGLVFGVLLTRIFLFAMTAMSGYKVAFILPVTAVLIGLILSLVVTQLAALFPARRATRIRILDAIQYE